MVRAATPDHAAPALDIKLAQNSNAFFFPASTISGHVIYKNHHGNADYDLRLIFAGTNKISVYDGDTTVPEKATLFEYTFNLHTARKGQNHILSDKKVDTAPMTFPFKHRFPSATDNRSFQVSLSAGSTLNTAFSNHVHDLPPSFGAHSYDFHCSVEYSLRAELYYDNCLLSHQTLPVMFLPYMRPAHGARQSPTFFPNPSGTFGKPLSTIRKDSLIGYLPDSMLSVDVQLPGEITVGLPFTFEIQVQLPFRPTFDDEVPVVKVQTLKMLSTTQCRTVGSTSSQGKGTSEQQFHKSKTISLHPSSATSAPTLDTSTNTIYYSFQATLSSYYPPSFRSFLVSNTFTFGGTLLLSVDGEKVELMIATNEVAVLSPVSQQPGTRRTSVMTANNRFGAY